jgi:dipeptidyl aminopeptidase/acylaminoacyl peptidase
VEGAEFLKDGALVGVAYDTDRPHMFYIDTRLRPLMQRLDTALSETTNRIVDCTADVSLCIVHSSGDVQPGVWMLLDTTTQRLTALGRSNPALDPEQLGHMQPISYPARDGTIIPGYLTKPPDAPVGALPLIVMPHGGPIARDRWNYFFLQQFLVSRGYAVLQMNFRGSGGYGFAWAEAAHQDWGGLSYDDIIDGVRWAIKSGVADPARVGIVGWGFGGYSALLGAVRDSDLFRCAVSIAGISDLGLLLQQERHYYSNEIAREQIGTQQAKLEADSPRRHAADVKVPVLMFHGDLDTRIAVDQSRAMAAALKSANRPFRYVEIKGADERINDPHDRATMLSAIEEFLAANMGSGSAPPGAP